MFRYATLAVGTEGARLDQENLDASATGATLPLAAECGETFGLANRRAARARSDGAGLGPASSQITLESDDGEPAHERARQCCLSKAKLDPAVVFAVPSPGCAALIHPHIRLTLYNYLIA